MLPDFRLFYKTTIVKTVWYWQKNKNKTKQKQTPRSMEQNGEPRNKPTHLRSINLWQRRQKHTMGKDSPFNKWCWTATHKRMKLEHFLTSYTKVNLKWIKDVNVRLETIKLLEENIGRTLCDLQQYIFGSVTKCKGNKMEIKK